MNEMGGGVGVSSDNTYVGSSGSKREAQKRAGLRLRAAASIASYN